MVACDAISCAKKRYAAAVGTRPAEVCGWYKKPPSSRSAMTFRIVAVLSDSSNPLEIAREDTGSPVSMYVRTISARMWRLRRSCSATVLIAIAALWSDRQKCFFHCRKRVKYGQRDVLDRLSLNLLYNGP